MIGMCESLVYAHRAGLDAEAVIKAIGAGAAGSWAVNNLGPRVAKRDFLPGFMIEHMAKARVTARHPSSDSGRACAPLLPCADAE